MNHPQAHETRSAGDERDAEETQGARAVKGGVDLARVRAAIAPVLTAHRVVLVDLEWMTDRAGWVLRLTIEREGASDAADGGVTLDDCAEVSRDTSAVLDVEDLIAQRYHLEVSSPGLDRPLRSEADFARFAGKTAKVKLGRPAPDGQHVLRGTLDAAPAGRVAVIADGKRVEVPFADVTGAHLVFELTPQPKKPKRDKDKGASPGERKADPSRRRPVGSQ